MTIALTCSCSARLEVDDRFAGQKITCPDCQKPLEVPLSHISGQRTSGLALLSLVLALIGAFFPVVPLVAVVLGWFGLRAIKRDSKNLAGANFAIAGMALGGIGMFLSLSVYFAPDLLGLDGMLRQASWLGKLEYPDDLEIRRKDAGFKITRPAPQWGLSTLRIDPTQTGQGLLLVNPQQSAFLLCLVEDADIDWTFDRCQEKALQLFRQMEITGTTMRRNAGLQVGMEMGKTKRLWNKEENGQKTRFMETTVQKTLHGQSKTYLVRVIKKDEGLRFGTSKLYIVAIGTSSARFPDAKKEKKAFQQLQQALDTFQIID